jgi:solute carrier family 25 carnitine/acylcarnitine transporter 20/29
MMSQPIVIRARHPGLFARLGRPSFVSVARGIYTQDGFRGFFRGLGPTFLRAFPVNASAFFVFEAILRVLGAEEVRYFLLNGFPLKISEIRLSCSDSALIDQRCE